MPTDPSWLSWPSRRAIAALAAILPLLALAPSAGAAPLSVTLDRYAEHVGTRSDFFTGRLLTGGDLDDEQSAVRLGRVVSRYIGETEKALDALFDRIGELSVVLTFDEADALFGRRTDVEDGHSRFDDLILLEEGNRFRGQVVLAGIGELPPGVYDLVGTFAVVRVAGPPPLLIVLLGAAALGARRRRQRSSSSCMAGALY
jgi:MYXO-CTERM domain-containing protein